VLGSGPQWLRLEAKGDTVRFKIWSDGQNEPAAWTGSFTDSAVAAAGSLHLSQVNGSAATGTRSVRLDDLVVHAS
jgi:hypothetical protein